MKRITFETAKLAKKVGFNKDCFFAVDALYPNDEHLAYDLTGETFFTQKDILNAQENGHDCYLLPFQSQLQEWLRTKLIFVNVDFDSYKPDVPKYFAEVKSLSCKNMGERLLDGFSLCNTYEEAFEEGLAEGLKILIKRNEI